MVSFVCIRLDTRTTEDERWIEKKGLALSLSRFAFYPRLHSYEPNILQRTRSQSSKNSMRVNVVVCVVIAAACKKRMEGRRDSSGAHKESYTPPPLPPPLSTWSAVLLRFELSVSHVRWTLRALCVFVLLSQKYFAWCDINVGTATLHCRRLLFWFNFGFFSFLVLHAMWLWPNSS